MCIHNDNLDHLVTDFETVKEIVCVRDTDQQLILDFDNIDHLILSNMIENEDEIEIDEADIVAQARLCSLIVDKASDLYIDKYDKNDNLLFQLN